MNYSEQQAAFDIIVDAVLAADREFVTHDPTFLSLPMSEGQARTSVRTAIEEARRIKRFKPLLEPNERVKQAQALAAQYVEHVRNMTERPSIEHNYSSQPSPVTEYELRRSALLSVLRSTEFVMGDGPGGPPSDQDLLGLADELMVAYETGI